MEIQQGVPLGVHHRFRVRIKRCPLDTPFNQNRRPHPDYESEKKIENKRVCFLFRLHAEVVGRAADKVKSELPSSGFGRELRRGGVFAPQQEEDAASQDERLPAATSETAWQQQVFFDAPGPPINNPHREPRHVEIIARLPGRNKILRAVGGASACRVRRSRAFPQG